jgi:L-aminopeptidase/D-esterase-like protein
VTVAHRNLITDVAGVRVGHADDARVGSGVTAIVFDEPAVASIDLRGGGTGTRATDMLDPAMTVERVDAITLSGGSAFGLESVDGVHAWLREHGRGFRVRTIQVPIVPGAILFDLVAAGDKDWGRFSPYRDLGYAAATSAGAGAGVEFALGSTGAGLGATTADFKGGVGSASGTTEDGLTVGALAAVNAAGSTVIGGGPWFWAAPFEQDAEFGGLGLPPSIPADALRFRTKGTPHESTTLVVVATDASLTKAQAKRLAIMAHTGLARSIYPVHLSLDGDVVFAAATGRAVLRNHIVGLSELGAAAANVVARAVARAVYEATALPLPGAQPAWRDRFAPPPPQ